MKKQKIFSFTGLLGLIVLIASSVLGQTLNPDRLRTVIPVSPGIDLSVRQFSGEFTEWKNEYNESDPTIVSFRAITNNNTLHSARWQVCTGPNNASTVIAEGQAGILQVNQYLAFTIDFRTIVGSNQHRPLTYWVRLLGFKNVRFGQDPPPPMISWFVRISFVGQGPSTTFTFEGLNPDLANSMRTAIRLQTLKAVGDTDIEPYLLVAAIYADGTTIVPEVDLASNKVRFSNSQVRIARKSETHGNILGGDDMDSEESVPIPSNTGYFETRVRPIGLQFVEQFGLPESEKRKLRENTQVAIVVVGMEEDAVPSTETANEVYGEFITALQEELDTLVRGVQLSAVNPQFPNLMGAVEEIKKRLRKRLEDFAKAQTIAELESYLAIPGAPMLATFGAANADDYIGTGVKVFTYQELLEGGESGIPFTLDVSDNPDEEVSYTIYGKAYALTQQ